MKSHQITSHHMTWHLATNHITSPHVTSQPTTLLHLTMQPTTSKQVTTSPPWNGWRLVHSNNSVWASQWLVTLCTFYRQILSLTYSYISLKLPPPACPALLVYIYIHDLMISYALIWCMMYMRLSVFRRGLVVWNSRALESLNVYWFMTHRAKSFWNVGHCKDGLCSCEVLHGRYLHMQSALTGKKHMESRNTWKAILETRLFVGDISKWDTSKICQNFSRLEFQESLHRTMSYMGICIVGAHCSRKSFHVDWNGGEQKGTNVNADAAPQTHVHGIWFIFQRHILSSKQVVPQAMQDQLIICKALGPMPRTFM